MKTAFTDYYSACVLKSHYCQYYNEFLKGFFFKTTVFGLFYYFSVKFVYCGSFYREYHVDRNPVFVFLEVSVTRNQPHIYIL